MVPVSAQPILRTENLHWAVSFQPSTLKKSDAEYENVYQKIVSGKAYELLQPGSKKTDDANEMGEGAKSLGDLKECGCRILGRSSKNPQRENFETQVIGRIMDKQEQLPFIRITAFATGLLFGELVLLLKIVDKLSKLNINKIIEFSCIDDKYETMKADFETTHVDNKAALEWKRDVDKAVNQFNRTVRAIMDLPSVSFSSSIELRFFSSVDAYIEKCKSDSKYQHDFLIGADRGATDKLIVELEKVGTGVADAIFLERRKNKPFMHIINARSKESELKKLS